jgi:hypothetical protein
MRRTCFTLPAAALLATLGCAPTESSAPDAGATPVVIPAGELCQPQTAAFVVVRSEPSFVVLAPCANALDACATRSVKIEIDPDFCQQVPVTFETSNADIVAAPAATSITYGTATIPLSITAGATEGTATITTHVAVPTTDANGNSVAPTDVTGTLTVVVQAPTPIACSGTAPAAPTTLFAGKSIYGTGGLTGATISLPVGANDPNSGSFLWSVAPFAPTLSCGAEATLQGYVALGPAITFGPDSMVFQREVPLSIPINPALMPNAARWRHLRIAYSGPAFKAPRTIPVADPRIAKIDDAGNIVPAEKVTSTTAGQWAVTFKAPRLGTYQAFVAADAGTQVFQRAITHRAVAGVSMGGGGAAAFGLRHHNLFDVLAPLGGPVDWTWLLNYIEEDNLGGFRPIASGTTLKDIQLTATPCTTNAECLPDETCLGAQASAGQCVLLPTPNEPYEHTQTFNTWWYEYPNTGNGGTFSRQSYIQIFRDLALMFGDPGGQNNSPGAQNLPAGVPPTDKSEVGDHPGNECAVWVEPLGDAQQTYEQELANDCPTERCMHPLTLQNYYDGDYNPDGIFPVITICDGSTQNPALSPYSNTWTPPTSPYPLELALAVDYNGNGTRDELEPVIRAGHEPWTDTGVDGIPSSMEPGYEPGVNDDPHGDDYNAQYNPGGTELDHRYQLGEPFQDVGLDGVANTPQQPKGGWAKPGDGYDVGEGDGMFTAATGLQTFWDRDPHSIIHQWVSDNPAGPLTDAALARIDLWTDGGTRDLFNFDVDAQHLVGNFVTRNRDVAYMTNFSEAPGLDPTQPDQYNPANVVYEDLQGIIMQRYGEIDPSPMDIADGSGQHVGTPNEIASRLQSALYFIGSRWQDHPELFRYQANSDAPPCGPILSAPTCEVTGNCTISFTSKEGRTGPVGITFPPGYANGCLADRRYPVIYMLHGYGQTPQDLEAAIVFLQNWMNSPTASVASRLPKAILVYVDGRCRLEPVNPDGSATSCQVDGDCGESTCNQATHLCVSLAECMQGTFFADSVRATGAEDEQWWLELMDYMDQNYRTLGPNTIDWAE